MTTSKEIAEAIKKLVCAAEKVEVDADTSQFDRWRSVEATRKSLQAAVDGIIAEKDAALAELEKVKRLGSPGVLHAVDQAFYKVAVAERNLAWYQLEREQEKVVKLSKIRDIAQHLVQTYPSIETGRAVGRLEELVYEK